MRICMPIFIGIALGLDRREPRLHDSEHVVCMSVCACASLSCGSGLLCSSIIICPTIISEYTRPCRKRAGGHAFSYTRARSHTFSKTRAHSRTRMHVHALRDYSDMFVSKARFAGIHRPGHGPAHETSRNLYAGRFRGSLVADIRGFK